MADKKISELTELTTPDGTEELVVNDGGVSKKITQANLLKGIDNTAADATAITIDSSKNVEIGSVGGSSDSIKTYSYGNAKKTLIIGRDSDQSSRLELTYDSHGTENAYLSRFYGAAKLHFDMNGADHMVIDKDGNVGIGTSSPSSYDSDANDLVVATSGNTGITIKTSSTGKGSVFFADGTTGSERYQGIIKYDHSDNSMLLATAGSEAMRIDSAGKVGIGTSSPVGKLHIKDNSSTNNQYLNLSNTESGHVRDWSIGLATASSGALRIFDLTANSERLKIDSAGRVTMPYQPAFFARPPANYSVATNTIIGGTWTEDSDNNNNFNTSTGVFTAPVSGYYHFYASMFINDGSSRIDTYITVNNAQRARTEINGYSSASTNKSSNVTLTYYLGAGDYAKVGVYTNGSTAKTYSSQSPWGQFSGHLIG